jgi:hypothetical protein
VCRGGHEARELYEIAAAALLSAMESAPEIVFFAAVNLAAKLLALKPGLTVAELRRAIVEAADEKAIGEGRTIRLLNPRASVEQVMGRRDVEVRR